MDGVLLNRNFLGLGSADENPVALFHEKLMAAGRDPNVRAVVLRINSPGGSVTATDLMRHQLTQFRVQTGKPVLASILDGGREGLLPGDGLRHDHGPSHLHRGRRGRNY